VNVTGAIVPGVSICSIPVTSLSPFAIASPVARAAQSISFGPLAGKTFGDAAFTLSATATSGLPVTFSLVSGNAILSSGMLAITGAGPITVRASQAGNASFAAAVSVDQSFVVAKATPVIAWSAPANITAGTPLGAAQLNATASVAGTFAYTPPAGTVLAAGAAQTLSVLFTPADAANENPASKTVSINVVAAANSPLTSLRQLEAEVRALGPPSGGVLNLLQTLLLLLPLEVADSALVHGRPIVAQLALETFQLEVRALVRSHALTAARGNALIAEAAAIIG
jgi:hypothetical protein